MQKRIVLVAAFAFLALVSIFTFLRSKNIPAFGAGLETKRRMPTLLVLQDSDSGCVGQLIGGDRVVLQKWFRLPKCPDKTENVIFDTPRNRVIVFQDGRYWAIEKKLGTKPKLLAEGFKSPIEGEFYSKTWIDKRTHALMVGYLVPVGDIGDNSGGDEWRKRLPLLKDTWISLHKASGDPPAGEPSVALVAQLDKNLQWQTIAEQKTTCCADLAPGFEVVKEFILEDDGVKSLEDLLLKSTCQVQQCDLARLKPSQETLNWIKQTFGGEGEQTVSYVPLGSNDGFLFHTEFGDSNHAVTPVYYCKNECSERLAVDPPAAPPDFRQISFAPKSDFMIVSKEYEGQDAKVYETGSPHPILAFGADARALWLPDEFQF